MSQRSLLLGVCLALIILSTIVAAVVLKLPVESDRAARPTVVFVDDGVTVSTKPKLIVLNDAGKSGEHFNDLYVSFYGAKSTPSRDIVIDVVAENGIAQPAEIARAIHVAIDEEADIVNISLSIEKSTDELEEAIAAASRKGIVVVAATQSGLEKVDSYPAAFDSVIGVYPRPSVKDEYWFGNPVGADFGMVVPPEGGSSLAAVLATAKIVECVGDPKQGKMSVLSLLYKCSDGAEIVKLS